MDRPLHNPQQIFHVLREAQLRLEQGDSLAAVCRSLGISPSSYRRWRIKYGGGAKQNAAAVAGESSEQRARARLTSTENLLAKEVKARPSGKGPKLSEEAQGFLDEANGASDPASTAWLAFLALLTYPLVTLAGVSRQRLSGCLI
jgi:putative transposase